MSIKRRIKDLESISPEEPTIMFINDAADTATVGYERIIVAANHQPPAKNYFLSSQETIADLEDRIYQTVKKYPGAHSMCFCITPISIEAIEHFGETGLPGRPESELEKLKIQTHIYGDAESDYLDTSVS